MALTGATGFVGKNLLAALDKSDYPIRALTRRRQADQGFVSWVNGDLNNQPALDKLVEGCTSVIHCAGTVRGNSLEDFLEVNLKGTENLLAATLKITPPPRFLLISSVAARYPDYSWYSRSKSMAEALLMSDRYSGLSRTIYRPTAIYGPGDKEMQPLLRLMRYGFLLTPGTPDARISLLHVNDLVDAILKWLTAREAYGLFELDDGTRGGYRWADIRAIGRDTWKRPLIHIQVPVALLKGLAHINLLLARVFRYPAMLTPGKVNEITHEDWVCDNAPLTNALGWRPNIHLADTLDTVI